MAYMISDQNYVGFFYESGTYASTLGTTLHWPGLVQNHEVDETVTKERIRYTGTGDRNVSQFENSTKDVTGTLSIYPQDWKFLAFALGSNVDAGSPSPYSHVISEVNSDNGNYATSGTKNPFTSFTIEDSHMGPQPGSNNFVRTVVGCMVDSFSVSSAEGEMATVEVNYIAQNVTAGSGERTAITQDTSRPYKWQDFKVHLESGNTIDGLKDVSLTVNNNLVARHYLNGSQVIELPIPTTRDYELSLTLDESTEWTQTLYNTYFLTGSKFNVLFEVNDTARAGSASMLMSLSGCVLDDMSYQHRLKV